ncbi:MAG: sugar ABC transporter substrate-binding protein [Clostridiales bacterium]|nr:sugar ABC transporter substrate-binding protein [Clostridiales bacterium]
MKRVIMLSVLCLLLTAFLIIWGFGSATENNQKPSAIPRALLLVERDTGTYLMQLRKGLQEALQERNGHLSVERLDDINLNDSGSFDHGLSVIYLLSDNPTDYIAALHQKNIPLVILGQDIRGEASIVPDEEGGGKMAGDYLAAKLLPDSTLSILADEGDPIQLLRLKGLSSRLGNQSFHVYSYQQINKELLDHSSVLIALSQSALSRITRLRQKDGPSIYGFNAEDLRVGLMEDGVLEGIVAEDPYAMGYIAGGLLDDIQLELFKPFLYKIPMRLVTAQTLYDAANVKLMFPLLH